MLVSFATWFIIFIIYSIAGWCMEVIINIFQHHKFINRGFLVGPICPIYGTGAVAISLVLSGAENPFAIFCVSLVGSAILEYLASYLMEKFFRVRWWDYSNKPFNINGRICLTSLIAFGFFGVLAIKVITPSLQSTLGELPVWLLYLIASSLFTILIADIFLSLWLVLGVRVTVGTVQKDATDEISERVQEILMGKGKLNRRLVKAFPNQAPSKKPVRSRRPRQKS